MYQYCAHTRLLSINPYFVNNLCNLADNNVQKLRNCSSTCPLLACIVSLHSGNSLMSYAQTSKPLGTPFGRPIVSGIPIAWDVSLQQQQIKQRYLAQFLIMYRQSECKKKEAISLKHTRDVLVCMFERCVVVAVCTPVRIYPTNPITLRDYLQFS